MCSTIKLIATNSPPHRPAPSSSLHSVDQLVRNHAVDGAVDLLYSQAAGADDALAASLIAGTGFGAAVGAGGGSGGGGGASGVSEGGGGGGGGGNGGSSTGLSPVEAMFSEHLKTVLVGFKQHEDRLNSTHKVNVRRRQSTTPATGRPFPLASPPHHPTIPPQARVAALQYELNCVARGAEGATGAGAQVYTERMQKLEERHKEGMGVLLSDLSGYLASVAVPPTLLPTTAGVIMRRGPGVGSNGGSGSCGGGGCGDRDGPTKKETRFQMRVLGVTTAADVAEVGEGKPPH